MFELRQWVNQYSANPFPGETLPPALSTAQLLDRDRSHTSKCASCRAALANIQRLRLWLAIVVAVITIINPPLALSLGKNAAVGSFLLTGLALVLGAAWLWLGRLEKQFYQGREVPLRNLPEKG